MMAAVKTSFGRGALFAHRFEIERVIGSGGMGTVYRARDVSSGDLVALKLLSGATPGLAETARFVREARLLSELRHPRIVSYVAHGQGEDGQLFLAMEWLEGEDLSRRLARGALSIGDCVALLRHVSEALCVAHERGVVHRDLKPQNLFLPGGEIGRVKLLDFGIARKGRTSQAVTRTGMVVGTPEYMAPEQAQGERELYPTTDVFALGCVLYECLAGQPPFTGAHLVAVLTRIVLEDPPPASARRARVPPALEALLGRMLAKQPGARPADAAALLLELSELGPLPDEGSAQPMAQETAEVPAIAPGFAGSQQHLFSVVVAAAPGASGHGVTAAAGELEEETARQAALSRELARIGVKAAFLLDGSLVVTTVPSATATDQAAQAARAALLIRAAWPAAEVALATGRGVLRGQGPVGEVVDRALYLLRARAAAPAGVLLDELSAGLLDRRFVRSGAGEEQVLVGEVTSADEARPLLGRAMPCIGRDQELGILEALLSGCIDESRAQAVLITAPPGFGKTRLRREFVRRLEARGEGGEVTVLLGLGDPLTTGAPYALMGQALRRLCDLWGGEPPEVQREHLSARLARHLPEEGRARTVALLGELCSVVIEDAGDAVLRAARRDPALLNEQMSAAFLDLLRAETRTAAVVLVLEDLHWADALSVRLLDLALGQLDEAPLLVVALSRPEIQEQYPRLWQGQAVKHLPLPGLGRRACERLIHHALGKALEASAVTRLVEQSAGNALYLEELIRAVAEGKAVELPPTVMAMLEARLSRLPAEARQVLHAASLFGQTFWRGGVARVLEGVPGAVQVEAGLRALVAAEFVELHRTSRLSGAAEYGFRHALMREAAYGLLTEEDRRLGHRLAGEYLEQAGEQDPLVLIDHYHKGNEIERTVPLYLRAAQAAEHVGARPETRRCYESALQTLSKLGDAPERRRLRGQVLLNLLLITGGSEAPAASLERLAEVESLLSEAGAGPAEEPAAALQRGMIHAHRARIQFIGARYAAAAESARAALAAGEELHRAELRALASLMLGYARGWAGWAPEGEMHLLESKRLFSELSNYDLWGRAQASYGSMLALQGGIEAGLTELRQAEERARAIGHPVLLLFVHAPRALIHCFAGDWPAAAEAAEAAALLEERTGIRNTRIFGLFVRASAELGLGRAAAAQVHLDQADEEMATLGGRLNGFDWILCAKAELALSTQRFAEALALADEVRTHGHPLSQGIAERIRGRALSRLDPADRDAVDASMAESVATLTRGNLRVEIARTRLSWALLCRERGEAARAQALYAAATGDLATFGCGYALDEAVRQWGQRP
jgi:predicted ATPase